MAYVTRYDPSTDWALNSIVVRTQTYLKGGSAFGTDTSPTLVQLETMIDDRVYLVGAELVKAGYAELQPVATVGTAVATLISRAVVMGVMLDIEQTRANQSQGRGESARWTLYERQWKNLIELFAGSYLETMGATRERDASTGLIATGASWDEQDDIADDEDRKGSAFPRGYLEPSARESSRVEITDPAN